MTRGQHEPGLVERLAAGDVIISCASIQWRLERAKMLKALKT